MAYCIKHFSKLKKPAYFSMWLTFQWNY
jgi:hypothetical protein